ncbi:MAG: hypothetical protein AAGF12_32540, partial [Myxococcota bacterium]
MSAPIALPPFIQPAYTAILSFDRPQLRRTLASASIEDRWVHWARGWEQLLSGSPDQARSFAEQAGELAGQDADASLVVEAAALRALAALEHDALEDAVVLARRASRMARVEGLPEPEYMAHLVLARARRVTGHPHLAVRILSALADTAPAPWHGWLAWELALGGALERAAELVESAPNGPAREITQALLAFLRSCAAGAHNAEATATLLGATVPLLRATAADVVDACVIDRTPKSDRVRAFCFGQSTEIPRSLHGLLTRRDGSPEPETAVAYVRAPVDGLRRRIPALAWALGNGPEIQSLPQSRRKEGRVESLVAYLLMKGEAVDEAACFSDVYG